MVDAIRTPPFHTRSSDVTSINSLCVYGMPCFDDTRLPWRNVVQVVMVMELAGHGDLLEYIKLRGALPEDKARKLFIQLLNAVSYIHAMNIVHR